MTSVRAFAVLAATVLVAIGIGAAVSDGLPAASAPGSYCAPERGAVYGPADGRFTVAFPPGRVSELDEVAECSYAVSEGGAAFDVQESSVAYTSAAPISRKDFPSSPDARHDVRPYTVGNARGYLLGPVRVRGLKGHFGAVLLVGNATAQWGVSVYGAGASRAVVMAFIRSFHLVE